MVTRSSDKPELRRSLLRARARLSPKERDAAAQALSLALRPLVLAAHRVASYAGVGTEPATAALNALRGDVLLPVLLPDGDLDWAAGPLRPGTRGLREPGGPTQGPDAVARCDLVLVPALAVDPSGTRLGRGGGSYDRALARVRAAGRGRTVALLYDGELLDSLPREPHDVPVHGVATPSTGLRELDTRA